VGANLPWVKYGGDFGANAWSCDGGVRTRLAELTVALDRLAAMGVGHVRWFMLCDGRAGVLFDDSGAPLALDEHVFPDVDAALTAAGARGIRITFVLLDFHWCQRPRTAAGVQLGGRARVLSDSTTRAALLDRVIAPILQRYGAHPQITAWDVINEPEWVTSGLGRHRWRSGISLDAMRQFIGSAVSLIHQHTSHSATVGSASAHWLDAWRDLDLDLYQTHWYEKVERRAPLARHVESLGLDRPVILGEFPSRRSAADLRRILATARAAGYGEALFWSALAQDTASDCAAIEAVLRDEART
jgi:hypothetical protein